jgi:hypothetical protein
MLLSDAPAGIAGTRWRNVVARLADLSIVVIATAGLWLFWSQYTDLSRLSWWYDNTQHLPERTAGVRPDYDLSSLPWKVTRARLFDVAPDRMTMVTSSEPFEYQALATISTAGAKAVDIQFEVDVGSGGVTIGVQQAGKWIAVNSTRKAGSFVEGNSAQLTYHRSATIVIANDNPAGESRLTVKSLRLFLRK